MTCKMLSSVVMMSVLCSGLAAQTITWQQDADFFSPSGIANTGGNPIVEWAWGDIDADGRLDIIIARFDYDICCRIEVLSETASGSGIFQNNIAIAEAIDAPGSVSNVYLAELIPDNETPEIVLYAFNASTGTNAFCVLQRDSSGVWQKDWQMLDELTKISDLEFDDPSGLAFVDVDFDGTEEFLFTEGAVSDSVPLNYRFFEKSTTAQQPVFTENPGPLTGIEAMAERTYTYQAAQLIDVDGDGIADILQPRIVEGQQEVVYFPGQRDSSGISWSGEPQWLPFPQVFRLDGLTVFDLNGDGRDDLLSSFALQVFPAAGDGPYFESEPYVLSLDTGRPRLVLPVNFASDESELLVITEDPYGFVTALSASFFEPATLDRFSLWKRNRKTMLMADYPYFSNFHAEVTDLDQDGAVELSGWMGDKNEQDAGTSFSFTYSDTGSHPVWIDRSELVQGLMAAPQDSEAVHVLPSFSDLDDDGREDALLLRRAISGPDSGRVAFIFYQNTRNGSGGVSWLPRPDWGAGLPDTSAQQVVFTDLDQDGDADLVVGLANSRSQTLVPFVFYENSSAMMSSWQLRPGVLPETIAYDPYWGPEQKPDFLLADFDGDGDEDFLIRQKQAGLIFLRNRLITSVSDGPGVVLPGEIHVQVWPNPLSGQGRFSYSLQSGQRVSLRLYNIMGQVVRVLVEGRRPAGEHSGVIAVEGLPSGLYFLRLSAGGKTATRPLMIVR